MSTSSADVREAQKRDVDVHQATGGVAGDPIAMMLQGQNAEDTPIAERRSVRMEPVKAGSYRFRTKPGYRQTLITLRVCQEYDDLDKNVKWKKTWERNAKRVYGDNWKQVLKPDADLFDRLGIRTITFRPVPGQMEASFETSDGKLAAYIRQRITEPDYLGIIYEEVAPMAVEINGETVYVVPADDQSRAKMAAAAAGR